MTAAAFDLKLVVDPERLELPTSAFEAHCSIQLSYGSAPLLPKYTLPRFPFAADSSE